MFLSCIYLFSACPPYHVKNGDRCYQYLPLRLSAAEADAACSQTEWAGQGHQAVSNNPQEFDFIHALIANGYVSL